MSHRRSNGEPLKRFSEAKNSIGNIYNELETYVTDLSLFYNGNFSRFLNPPSVLPCYLTFCAWLSVQLDLIQPFWKFEKKTVPCCLYCVPTVQPVSDVHHRGKSLSEVSFIWKRDGCEDETFFSCMLVYLHDYDKPFVVGSWKFMCSLFYNLYLALNFSILWRDEVSYLWL